MYNLNVYIFYDRLFCTIISCQMNWYWIINISLAYYLKTHTRGFSWTTYMTNRPNIMPTFFTLFRKTPRKKSSSWEVLGRTGVSLREKFVLTLILSVQCAKYHYCKCRLFTYSGILWASSEPHHQISWLYPLNNYHDGSDMEKKTVNQSRNINIFASNSITITL